MVLPKEKAILSKIESIVKRLGGAKTPAEDKLIREAIEAEGKGKSFTPAPLTKSGRVGKDLSDPHELIKEGFKKAREKK